MEEAFCTYEVSYLNKMASETGAAAFIHPAAELYDSLQLCLHKLSWIFILHFMA